MRQLLFNISLDGENWTEQWMTDEEAAEQKEKGYQVCCRFCKDVEDLKQGEERKMCEGTIVDVFAMKNEFNRLIFVGKASKDITTPFPLAYCPKCGRKLYGG